MCLTLGPSMHFGFVDCNVWVFFMNKPLAMQHVCTLHAVSKIRKSCLGHCILCSNIDLGLNVQNTGMTHHWYHGHFGSKETVSLCYTFNGSASFHSVCLLVRSGN